MKMLLLLSLVSIGIGNLNVFSAESVEVPAIPWVEHMDPGFDFSSEIWNKALRVTQFMKPGAMSVMGKSFAIDAEKKTEVYALRTSDALYFGVICYDEDGRKRMAGEERLSLGIPSGNKFEIYIDGDLNDQQGYYQAIVNPDGNAWLSKNGEVISPEAWDFKTLQEDHAWKIWVRIPYESIHVRSDAEQIQAHFCRDYRPLKETDKAEYSTWQGGAPASFSSLRPLLFCPMDES